jgi:T3SS negative regulator,GrlR
MLRDGRYAAWFRTSHGEGTGIVNLANGRISGGDSTFTYSGSYQVDDDRFTAALTTRRHAAGPPTVFGIDEVEVKLTGKVNGMTASCRGTAQQAPGVTFEATLFLGQDTSPEPTRKRAALNFDADKLPKDSDSRFRARNPFARGLSRI